MSVLRSRRHLVLLSLVASAALAAAAALVQPVVARSPVPALELTPFGLAVALSASLGGLGPGLLSLAVATAAIHRVAPFSLMELAFIAPWAVFCAVADRLHREHERERQRCALAEGESAQAARLAQLTAALSHARTHAAAIEAALQEPLHALAADAGFILLVDRDGTPSGVPRAVGYTDAERIARETPPRTKTPAVVAVGRGAPVIVPSPDAYAAEYGSFPATSWSFETALAVPLLVGSRVIAVVQFEFRRRRLLTEDDLRYIDVLGPRGAQALDRTREFESALQARADAEALRERADVELAERQKVERALRSSEARYRALAARTSRLHGMASALAESATLRAVAAAVVQHGRNVLGAAAGEVLLLSGSSLVTLYADAPAVPAQISLQAGLCTTDVVANREPVFVSSFDEWQERFSRSATQAADGGYVSSATLPLLVDGAVMGTVAFHFTAPVNFDDEYRALLLSVAQQCAQALDRARVYEAAQQARAEAEAANRMKDEFVSIVSHELRTPLNAIIGWTSLLQQQGALDDDGRERAVQSVADNAARQLRLVQDLLDFSRLQAGRMSLDVEDIDLRTLIRGVVETILPTAAGSRLQIDVQPIPAIKVRGDATRLEQVFLNLLGNAVKFTPAGGQVRVGVRAGEGSVEITVGDTGEGIDPAFLPHMFEAFRQAETSRSSRHGGVGLGLSIAKQLVEAHNGNIRAESGGPGCGATFIVSLPVAATIAASTSGVVH